MATSTTLEVQKYYPDLLILQYLGQPKAYSHIKALCTPVLMPQTSTQTISFALAPDSGTFVLSYNGNDTAAINWDDPNATIQSKLQAVTGLGSVTVEGEIADLLLIITFVDVTAPALLLELGTNSLDSSGTPVIPEIVETDLTLPLAVQDAFNLTDGNIAVGDQLDIIGKYVGVERSGFGFETVITLDDTDYLTLIFFGIIRNSAQSSLSAIQDLINQFFASYMLVFDYKDMTMSYLISSSLGSQDLIQMVVTQNLLPRPMAVGIRVIIYAPIIDMFFGFRTYTLPAYNASPFNDYTDYQLVWPWLSYQDAIFV